MKRRKKRKIHNAVLKTITTVAAMAFLFSVCCIDTEGTNVFWMTCMISGIWLMLFIIANCD